MLLSTQTTHRFETELPLLLLTSTETPHTIKGQVIVCPYTTEDDSEKLESAVVRE